MKRTQRRGVPLPWTTASPAELEAYLHQRPWPGDWAALGATLDWLWTFDLESPPAPFWERLADSSAFNARLGLPEMRFEERDDGLYGSAENLGMEQAWLELPWEWVRGEGLGNARIYSKGLAKVMRSEFGLAAAPSGGTRLTVYLGWIPRSALTRFLLKASLPWVRRSYARVLGEMDAEISERRPASLPRVPPAPEEAARIKAAVERLRIPGVDPALRGRLGDLLVGGTDEELARIRPKGLALAWRTDLGAVLRLLLLATREGVFKLTWDVVCPHCRGVRSESGALAALPSKASCRSCGLDFDPMDQRNLDVTFHPHPSLRRVSPRLYCSAEAARKPHQVMQVALAPGERRRVRWSLPEGRYRARTRPWGRPDPLEIVPGAPGAGLWAPPEGPRPAALDRDAALELVNPGPQPRTFVLEQWDADAQALRPGELFNIQDFRDLFSSEAVATGMKLDVGSQCLLFTDLVGSTRFYMNEGDSVAFAKVHDHFLRVGDVVKSGGGAVVKTIGDACMAAFNEPRKALRAALEIQRRFPPGGLRLRASLHHGPCLAVHFNSNIDYFGAAVNYAAKLQAAAGAGEVVFSGELAGQPGVQEALEEAGQVPEAFTFSHEAYDRGTLRCFRLKVS